MQPINNPFFKFHTLCCISQRRRTTCGQPPYWALSEACRYFASNHEGRSTLCWTEYPVGMRWNMIGLGNMVGLGLLKAWCSIWTSHSVIFQRRTWRGAQGTKLDHGRKWFQHWWNHLLSLREFLPSQGRHCDQYPCCPFVSLCLSVEEPWLQFVGRGTKQDWCYSPAPA